MSSDAVARATRPPLSALLTRPLLAFDRDYDEMRGNEPVPSLAMWSNCMRELDEDGVDLRELPARTVISQRALRDASRHLIRRGWVHVEPVTGVRGRKDVYPTSQGRSAIDAGRRFVESIEEAWNARLGKRIASLRASLQALVQQFDLELPHYPTSYGQGDVSITGGSYVPGSAGPPRIPPHGEEWPIVVRDPQRSVAVLSLSALLSQVLTAFAIDYESQGLGTLTTAANFLRLLGDDGMRLGDTPPGTDVSGSGRSGLERHGIVRVGPGSPKRDRLVRLTRRGARHRDAYESLAVKVERDWRAAFGNPAVEALRGALDALDNEWDDDLPQFPSISAWLRRGD